MRITGLTLDHWLIHQYLDVEFSPMAMVTGPNESGKSSVRDAVAFALMGTLTRVDAKADRHKLKTTGAEKGLVTIRCSNGDGTDVAFARDIDTGKPRGGRGSVIPIGTDAVGEAVRYVLDPPAFAGEHADERRNLLLEVMRVSMDPPALRAELLRRGHALAEQLGDSPISDWIAYCERQASENRGAWKASTGEVYGPAKAETWAPAGQSQPGPTVEDTQNLSGEIQALRERAQGLRAIKAKSDGIASVREAREQRLTTLRAKAAQLDEARGALATAESAVVEARQAAAVALTALSDAKARQNPDILSCVECGTAHILVGNILQRAPAVSGPNAPAPTQAEILNAEYANQRAKTALAATETILASKRQILQSINDAGTAIQELELQPLNEAEDLSEVHAEITKIEVEIPGMIDRLTDMQTVITKANLASGVLKRATAAHSAVTAWTALAEVLKPSGLPSEMLAKALGPFNHLLADLSSAVGWSPITLSEKMAISRGAMPYHLLSESAQWRCDLIISVSLSIFARLRFVVIDRFDVLDIPSRKPVLVWLYKLVKSNVMDSIILLGTLKEPPPLPKDVKVHWLGSN